ncbi:MAG: hypothetical protein LBG92_12600 [Prevotellaceae bacterium]|jgi:hypothetical protein|nr:hypothetical protein [Prevotellaceae bacterium]
MKQRTVLQLFILYSLRREGKSNIGFRLACVFSGKKRATRRYFKKMFTDCDIATYRHFCKQFCEEHLCDIQKWLDESRSLTRLYYPDK